MRTHVVRVRMTPNEFSITSRRASALNMNVSQYLRFVGSVLDFRIEPAVATNHKKR